jgi:hypothetical protein
MYFDTLRLAKVGDGSWRVEFIDPYGEVVFISLKDYTHLEEVLRDLRCLSDCIELI